MSSTRREILVAGAGGLLLAGCARLSQQVAGRRLPQHIKLPPNPDPVVRILNRAGFGPAPGDVQSLSELGIQAYVDTQLRPDDLDDPALMVGLARFEALASDAAELEDLQEGPVLKQLTAAAILRATYSKWQLRERMVDFWTNHFNIFAQKAHGAYRKPIDDLEVIRKHALGSFPEMLAASAKSPAMLTYLDNQVNSKAHPNENYARELMELHTLGVHGGYTQQDVMEVARCFTGWGVENRFLHRRGAFRFDEDEHDRGEKIVLGQRIQSGGGVDDGQRVLEILATHPATATFVAQKICRHFLGDSQSPWVGRLAKAYKESGGQVAAMLRPLLLSPELLYGQPVPKRPFDYLVSALRVTGAHSDGDALQGHLSNMGQPLFGWPMPDGYPERASSWSGSMLARWNFALDLTSGRIPGTAVNCEELLGRAHDVPSQAGVIAILNRNPRAKDHVAVALKAISGDPAHVVALSLASPEFQYR